MADVIKIVEWVIANGDRGIMMAVIVGLGWALMRVVKDRLRLEKEHAKALKAKDEAHTAATDAIKAHCFKETAELRNARADLEVEYRGKIETLKDRYATKVEELMNKNLDAYGPLRELLAEVRDTLRRIQAEEI